MGLESVAKRNHRESRKRRTSENTSSIKLNESKFGTSCNCVVIKTRKFINKLWFIIDMVFLLEDIAKIEADRRIDLGIVEEFTHVQKSDNIIQDPETHKAISKIMEQYVNAAQYYVWGNEVIGILGVFSDAFLNAGMWGNKNMPGKKIKISLGYGPFGSLVKVQDEGDGFNFRSQIQKLNSGEKHNFSRNGGGMRKFHEYQGLIAYHENGNLFSVSTRIFSMEEFEKFAAYGKN